MTPPTAAQEREARKLAKTYGMLLEWSAEEECYYARGVEYPHLLGDGKTREAALKMGFDGLVACIATDLRDETLPPPLSDVRDRQVNIRVSGFEKQQLERHAKAAGFRGVSDFVRHAALEKAR